MIPKTVLRLALFLFLIPLLHAQQAPIELIAAENSAIEQYNKLIKLCDGVDYVTQDLCIQALGDEEEHRREFLGYLREYEGE